MLHSLGSLLGLRGDTCLHTHVVEMRPCVRSDDRYLLSFDPRPGRVLGLLPVRGIGQLRLTIRDDAQPADILQGIMHAACFRQQLLSARRRDPDGVQWGSDSGASRVTVDDGASPKLPVSVLLDRSRQAAKEEAAQLMQHLPAQHWQLHPFLLSSSERAGYTLELD